MKNITKFIYEEQVVKIDPRLRVGIDISKKPNEYNVTYIDNMGKIYKATTSDFDMRRYAEEAAECIFGTCNGIPKSWQDKLIKWVMQNSK